MFAVVGLASLALQLPTGPTRREVIIGGGLTAVASAGPANAAPAWDLIGAYNVGGKAGDGSGPVRAAAGKSLSGILLLRECFDGELPPQGLVSWYEEHLADDFQATFENGKVKLDKQVRA